jgi:hypothetical protein
MKISSFAILPRCFAPLSFCLGVSFVSYQPAVQAQVDIDLECLNEPNAGAVSKAEVLIPATVISGYSVTAIFDPQQIQKSMLVDPRQQFPNRQISLLAFADRPQQNVRTSGRIFWSGSIGGGGIASWRGTTEIAQGRPCIPQPPAGGGTGSGGSGGGASGGGGSTSGGVASGGNGLTPEQIAIVTANGGVITADGGIYCPRKLYCWLNFE